MKLAIGSGGLGKTGQSGPRGDSHSPIDMVHLSRQSLGDDALGSEILLVFVESAHIFLQRIMTAVAPEERVLHLRRLRLAANGVGAFRLAELVRMAEMELSSDPTRTECLADLGFAVEEVTSFVGDQVTLLAA